MHLDLGVYNFHCRRHDASIRHLQRTGEMTPDFHYPRMLIAWNHSLQGQHELASAECETLVMELGRTFDYILTGSCAWVYARSSRIQDAQALLNSLLNPPPGTRVDPVAISWACMGLDLTDCALSQLEKALQQRSSFMIYMQVAPAWEPLRDHVRFQSILERMDLPPTT
jgi:hypothetical protein